MATQLPIELSEASGVPYYRQVIDQVGELIASGELSAGDVLPSVRELAAQLLVSLITIRRAYAELEAAGMVVRRQGLGTFVADDVEPASRRQKRRDAHRALAEAIARARQLGIDDAEIRVTVDQLLDRPSSRPWRM